MLQIFQAERITQAIFQNSISEGDIESFQTLIQNSFSLEVHFRHLFFIPLELLEILDMLTCKERYTLKIVAHTPKVYAYLLQLGFRVYHIHHQELYNNSIENIEYILIGGSADSTDKIIRLVKSTSITHITLIIVQHVPADQTVLFDKLLQNHTSAPISYAKEHERIKKGHIYLAPANTHLLVKNNRFFLSDTPKFNHAKPSVSLSYESFSNHYKNYLAIIHECGFCADGVDKLELLMKNKTTVILQDPSECNAQEMIANALKTKQYHYILKIQDIISLVHILDQHFHDDDKALAFLTTIMQIKYTYDFTNYRHDMLKRRTTVFLNKHALSSIKTLILLVQLNPFIFKEFFLALSINVTEFFREVPVLKEFRKIIKNNYHRRRNIKIWDAGCATGEEAYTLAMILKAENKLENSIIYATDFNKTVTQEAQNGCYSAKSIRIGEQNVKNICEKEDFSNNFIEFKNFYKIKEKFRKHIFFFTHNLLKDESFNEFDIIFCRNVIIYFDIKSQKRVFTLFYNSLRFGGFLILGEKEFIHPDFSQSFLRIAPSIYRKTDA